MKKTNSNFNLTHLLGVLFFFLSFQVSYSQGLELAKNAFCENVDLKACLKEQIESADNVFEGRGIRSERYLNAKGEWRIKGAISIEKIFKGKFESDTIFYNIAEKTKKEMLVELSEGQLKMEDINSASKKNYVTGIYMFNKSEVKNNQFEITYLLRKYALFYQLGYKRYRPKEKKYYIFYTKRGEDELAFERAEDVYKFILSCEGTRLEDVTFRKFEKQSIEEWLKKKPKIKIDDDSQEKTLLTPSITSFTQDVPGGNHSKLVIDGANFGSSPGKIVFEYNGDPVFNQDEVITLDNYDLSLSSWNDEIIEVEIPNSVYDFSHSFEVFGILTNIWGIRGLLSAKFKIISSTEEPSSWTSTKLNIPYSLHQEIEIDENDVVIKKEGYKIIVLDI